MICVFSQCINIIHLIISLALKSFPLNFPSFLYCHLGLLQLSLSSVWGNSQTTVFFFFNLPFFFVPYTIVRTDSYRFSLLSLSVISSLTQHPYLTTSIWLSPVIHFIRIYIHTYKHTHSHLFCCSAYTSSITSNFFFLSFLHFPHFSDDHFPTYFFFFFSDSYNFHANHHVHSLYC